MIESAIWVRTYRIGFKLKHTYVCTLENISEPTFIFPKIIFLLVVPLAYGFL